MSSKAEFIHIPIRELSPTELLALSVDMKLSLSQEDMVEVQKIYQKWNREPTDVELEVIAQTWSEHCKHRIFSATIAHQKDGQTEEVKSLFKTFIKDPSEKIFDAKPGFVLSAFHDNAGFIDLDGKNAVCLKVETHNHPSAIEPYAGANTGLGGVIRDIIGAGKGATPTAALDVFCFGSPDLKQEEILAPDVIHPLGIMRGVVRGVRDYGNRMGIPTVGGAIAFDDTYTYNPLVFCGAAGVIEHQYIDKEMKPDLKIIVIGGRTGKDGLKGATFSSAALGEDSHEEDNQAVQIGNPIEEKKAMDFILEARDQDLIEFVTDCGAGGFSSAAGEMLSETGGNLYLERAPLKEAGLSSWQIFLSESQERMVLAVKEENLPALQNLADTYQTEMFVFGESNDSGILRIYHGGEIVCELDNADLHEAPVKQLQAVFNTPDLATLPKLKGDASLADSLKSVLADFAIVSREPVIREYDHEVQGQTILKPLAGATGDAPQDGAVMSVVNSNKGYAMGISLLPEWGKLDPYEMGLASVDETVRQLVLVGSNPQKIGLLDNFCMGNPEDPQELGKLVECVKGIADAAEAFQAPYISGKDSFYNYFEVGGKAINIPVTFLCSGLGIVEDTNQVTGSSLRKEGSLIAVIGETQNRLGGSVYSRVSELEASKVSQTDLATNFALYESYHKVQQAGQILSAHDISEGGLAVTIAEMAFSQKVGVEINIANLAASEELSSEVALFSESSGRIAIEVAPENKSAIEAVFAGQAISWIGETTKSHQNLVITNNQQSLISESIADLKTIWKHKLAEYY